jgi:D-sedoheptulose 7-phosphate isomerase
MNSEEARDLVRVQLHEALTVHETLLGSNEITDQIVTWAQTCANSLVQGGVIFFAGNGGSFADAQHLAAELTGKMGRMRSPLAGIALGTNSSSLSAIGNDFGYQLTFARELEGLSRPNSVVIALTTSGNSINVLELVDQAKDMGVPILVLTGASGGAASDRCPVIRVPSDRTERIQEMHILLGHTLCLLIEEFLELFPAEPAY